MAYGFRVKLGTRLTIERSTFIQLYGQVRILCLKSESANFPVSPIADASVGPRGGQTFRLRDAQRAEVSQTLQNEYDSSEALQTYLSKEPAMISSGFYQPQALLSESIVTANALSYDSTRSLCEQDCDCACHRRGKIQSPSYLSTILGSLLIGYSINPWMTRQCNSVDCRVHPTYITYTYAFPKWLLSRMVRLRIAYDQSRGPELCLRVMRVRPDEASIWGPVVATVSDESMRIQELNRLFINGEASVLDVDSLGSNALIVRIKPSSANNFIPDPINRELSNLISMKSPRF